MWLGKTGSTCNGVFFCADRQVFGVDNLWLFFARIGQFLARIGQGSAGVGSVSRRPLARISFSKTKDQVLLGAYPLEQLNETVRNNLNGITRYHLWERRAIAQKEAESDEWERARTGAGTNSTTGEWGRRRTEKGQGWGAGRKGGAGRGGARGAVYITTLWAEHVVKHCQACSPP